MNWSEATLTPAAQIRVGNMTDAAARTKAESDLLRLVQVTPEALDDLNRRQVPFDEIVAMAGTEGIALVLATGGEFAPRGFAWLRAGHAHESHAEMGRLYSQGW